MPLCQLALADTAYLQCLLAVRARRTSSGAVPPTVHARRAASGAKHQAPGVETPPSTTAPTYRACEKGQQWRTHFHLQCQLAVHARRASSGEHTFTYSEYLKCMRDGPAAETTPSPTVPTYRACEKGQQWRTHFHLQCQLPVHARRASSGEHTFTYSEYLKCMREGPAAETTPSPTVPTYRACEKGQQWRTHFHLQCQLPVHARRAFGPPRRTCSGRGACRREEVLEDREGPAV
jgi:hypothetical protein